MKLERIYRMTVLDCSVSTLASCNKNLRKAFFVLMWLTKEQSVLEQCPPTMTLYYMHVGLGGKTNKQTNKPEVLE